MLWLWWSRTDWMTRWNINRYLSISSAKYLHRKFTPNIYCPVWGSSLKFDESWQISDSNLRISPSPGMQLLVLFLPEYCSSIRPVNFDTSFSRPLLFKLLRSLSEDLRHHCALQCIGTGECQTRSTLPLPYDSVFGAFNSTIFKSSTLTCTLAASPSGTICLIAMLQFLRPC